MGKIQKAPDWYEGTYEVLAKETLFSEKKGDAIAYA